MVELFKPVIGDHEYVKLAQPVHPVDEPVGLPPIVTQGQQELIP
jgi:hypothetical protein